MKGLAGWRVAIGVTLALTGCAAHVQSTVHVNGVPFSPSTCRSGQPNGFSGVELADGGGRRLRLAQNLNGTMVGVYFPSGSQIGDELGVCVNMNVQTGVGVINGVRNVEGIATLDCRTETHQVTGSVRFENCH
jgi:hypothetical protein